MRNRSRIPLTLISLSSLLLTGCFDSGGGNNRNNTPPAGEISIQTLSSRPDMVSGGDTLVELAMPAGVSLDNLVIELNGLDVTALFTATDQSGGILRGLLDGLYEGDNTLAAETTGGARASGSLTLTNYPITGPILSGPHLTPYECRTVESGLGDPLDADCSAEQKIEYFYRNTAGDFLPYDPADPRPLDLAQTTTYDGRTVPYIVRVDGGTVNRTIYRIAILDDPSAQASPDSWTPGEGWNGKLAVFFGGSAGTEYSQGTFQATDALSHMYLSRGFAHMISTELVNGRRGNGVLQGETLMMLKEYFIEQYGVPKWTLGTGGSGGAIQQLVITQMYPGLLDGLQPSLAFPDSHIHVHDCVLFTNFYATADPLIWTPARKQAVEGLTQGGALGGTCNYWTLAYGPLLSPSTGCALNDTSLIYHPVTNPTGARCTDSDLRANIIGKDPVTGAGYKVWSNKGLQYGLRALNAGELAVDDFLTLNEGMGGFDADGNIIGERSEGHPEAMRATYESGLMASYNDALANVPILNFRTYTDMAGDIHDHQRDFTIRARLERSNGRSDNQVIWVSNTSLAGTALETMNVWLDNMAADPQPLSIDKVVENKPSTAVDACWDTDGTKIEETLSMDGTGECATLFPVHSEPRLEAGAPVTNDILECSLKPINQGDYAVNFNSSQWDRLNNVFPDGVCDWSKPGVEQVPITGTYQRY